MDRDLAVAKLLKAELYDHIRGVEWHIANLHWSRWEMDSIMRRYDDATRILRKILSE